MAGIGTHSSASAPASAALKVGFNKVFGYYIEVATPTPSRCRTTIERKQTLINAERYITPALKDAEQRVLAAEERIADAGARALSSR